MPSAIVDLLTCSVPQFTVDDTQNSVAISGASSPLLQVVTAYSLFAPRDNAIVKQVGINLPYQYCIADGLLGFEIGWANDDFSDTLVQYQGWLPFSNEPFQIAADPGLYLRNPQGTSWATRSQLYISIFGNVSAVTLPQASQTGPF